MVRLRRALAEEPPRQSAAAILAELGRYEVAAMEFEAAEESLRAALASDADAEIRADAASTLARCAIVSSGAGAEEAADALAVARGASCGTTDPDRSLALGSELLMLQHGAAAAARRPRQRAAHSSVARHADDAEYEAVADIHEALRAAVLGRAGGRGGAPRSQAALAARPAAQRGDRGRRSWR